MKSKYDAIRWLMVGSLVIGMSLISSLDFENMEHGGYKLMVIGIATICIPFVIIIHTMHKDYYEQD